MLVLNADLWVEVQKAGHGLAELSNQAAVSNSDLSWIKKQYAPCHCPETGQMITCQG